MFWYGFFAGWIFCGLLAIINELFHLDNIQIFGGLGWILTFPFVPFMCIAALIRMMFDPFYRTKFFKRLKKKFYKK